MKITKVNTTAGQFRLPVSTELSSVIERMQEPRTKEVANLTVLGKAIKKLKWRKSKINGTRGYYLRLKKQ